MDELLAARELQAPFAVPPALPPADRAALAAIRKRRDLLRSDTWTRLQGPADAACAALEFGRPPVPAPRPARAFLRVATWNIQRGNRLDGLLDVLRTDPRLADLDALMLNEVDLGMARSGNRNVAREVADSLGFEYVFGNSYVCLDHGDPRDGNPDGDNAVGLHGNAILSRFPLLRARNVPVHVTKDKFESSEKRLGFKKALWADVDTPLGLVRLVSAHLDSIAAPDARAAQLRDLLAAVDAAGPAPLLLGGDLNTHTYDVSGPRGLLRNLGVKLRRGGFPHGLYHYMHPWEIYEAPVFRTLDAAGLDWRAFNDLTRGTLHYTVGTFDCESAVREHLPGIAVHVLRWKLRPWNGTCPLRMDWFAGRGLRALQDGERADPDGRAGRAPRVVERPLGLGARISDHDPLVVDVLL